jgi:aminopeptidase N
MTRLLAAAAVLAVLVSGCSDDDEPIRSGGLGSGESSAPPTSTATPVDPPDDGTPDLDLALSTPREDTSYPEVGDPGVDALHYDLSLAWSPDTDTLEGTERLTFRSTATDDSFQLDFGEALQVGAVTSAGRDVDFAQDGKDLVVRMPVKKDRRYEVVIEYSGTPEPVDVPVQRADFSQTGFTITDDHEVWTMQEPWGAHSWYAVNDHPSDKALYDFTLSVPAPWTGIANGDLVSKDERDGLTVTRWHLAEPAASYLTTLAFGDYEQTDLTGPRGLPIRIFTPSDDPEAIDGPNMAPAAVEWLEQYLGPYPFDTLGIVVVESDSGMETQTMITLGDTDYTLSRPVVVHEIAHQWYGDTVTPNDWRDLWMNEGMAMYLQAMWEADQSGRPLDATMDDWARSDNDMREYAGPPGDYDPDKWGDNNVYYSAALMWHELRQQVGDERFFDAVRGWPQSQENRSSDREALERFFEESTGEELSAFFDAWLLGEQTPPRS